MGIKDKLKRTSRLFILDPKEDAAEATPTTKETHETPVDGVATAEPVTEPVVVAVAEPVAQPATGDVSEPVDAVLPPVGVAADTEAVPVAATEASEIPEAPVVAESLPEPTTHEELAAQAETAKADVKKSPDAKEEKNDFFKRLMRKFKKPAAQA